MNDQQHLQNDPDGVKTPSSSTHSVVDFLREKTKTRPDSLAVQEAGRTLTYGQLDLQSGQVAGELLRRGLALEAPVATLLPASCDYVTALLGILKAGGSYLPIDPGVPARRLEYMLRDSSARFVITDTAGAKRLGGWSGTVCELSVVLAGVSPKIPEPVFIAPGHRAYIVYTSGSTGQPKGVEIEHHSLTNLVGAYHGQFKLSAADRCTLLANVAFDASVADVWPTLCAGGTLVVPPRELLQNPDALIAWLANQKLTWTFIPTGLAEILFTRDWPETMALRFFITGGDRLRFEPPRSLPFTVLNAYGPTENTVISTWSLLTGESRAPALPAIGRPIANVKAYVLDELRQPVAAGASGELYLGGEQIARGYLGQPELTAQCFPADPFSGQPGARLYRTGDWVRWLPDGELDFIGRQDDQVQIRGIRVELGEIETALQTHPSVRLACCLPRLENGVATGIVAHVVPPSKSPDFATQLRAYLQPRLPAYMVPAQFFFHEQLPLTSNGKVDRAALHGSHTPVNDPPPVGPDTDGLETALAGLWNSLFPEAAGYPRDTTFAALGGDSLSVVRLMLGVEDLTGQRLAASTFLLQPTLPGLYHAVKKQLQDATFQPVLTLRRSGNRPPLFLLYNFDGDIDIYFPLTRALGMDQPVLGVRSPALADAAALPASLEAAAANVVAAIRRVQPRGIPALVGYSWAGLLAFEVARQFQKQEGITCFTALIGSEPPVWPMGFAGRLGHFFESLPSWLWHLATDRERRWQRLARWRNMLRGTRENLVTGGEPVDNWVTTPIGSHHVGLMTTYQPRPKSGPPVDLFRERDSFEPRPHPLCHWQTGYLPDAGWNRWTTQPVRVYWLEGDHKTILKPPAVGDLAAVLREAMDHHPSCQKKGK